MWFFPSHDDRNSTGQTIKVHNNNRNKQIIIIESLPKEYEGKIVNSFHHAFEGMDELREVIFNDSVDLSKIELTRCMFNKCPKLERVVFPANSFPNIFDCSYMFQDCPSLKEIIAPNIFISTDTNRISQSLEYFNGIFNGTPINKNNAPRSLNWIVETDEIMHGPF